MSRVGGGGSGGGGGGHWVHVVVVKEEKKLFYYFIIVIWFIFLFNNIGVRVYSGWQLGAGQREENRARVVATPFNFHVTVKMLFIHQTVSLPHSRSLPFSRSYNHEPPLVAYWAGEGVKE